MTIISKKITDFFVSLEKTKPLPKLPVSVKITLTYEDGIEETTILDTKQPAGKDNSLGYAEGQSFIIEYIDAAGKTSIRRISVWNISKGASGIPTLVAKCHERNATRSFRIDRIKSICDFDGVAEPSVPSFLVQNFGMSPSMAQLAAPHGETHSKTIALPSASLAKIKSTVRKKGVHLLWCFANADNNFHQKELDQVVKYSRKCCANASIQMTVDNEQKLRKYITNLRPTIRIIDECVKNLVAGSETDLNLFLEYCIHVANADGKIHPNEVIAINTISKELVGRTLL